MNNTPPPADDQDLAAQVIDLEQKLTFQQRSFDELNSVVLEQQSELELLRREMKSLRQLLHGFSGGGLGEDLPHEKQR